MQSAAKAFESKHGTRYFRVMSCGQFRDVLAQPEGMDQSIALLAYSLCDQGGKLIYATPAECSEKLPITEFAELFEQAQTLNVLDAMETKKNSNGRAPSSLGSGSQATSRNRLKK